MSHYKVLVITDKEIDEILDKIDYDKYITIANNFIKNKLSNYKHNLENTMELNIPIQQEGLILWKIY